MHLKVLYFAQLREKFGLAEESVQTPEGVRTIADLMQHLGARGGVWQDTLGGQYAFRVASLSGLQFLSANALGA